MNKHVINIPLSALRAFFMYFAFIVISKLAQLSFINNFFESADVLGTHFFDAWNCIILLFVYPSTVRALNVYDALSMKEYLNRSSGGYKFFREIKHVILSPVFITEIVCISMLSMYFFRQCNAHGTAKSSI